MKPTALLRVLALAVAAAGCVIHRTAPLPASIPPAPGDTRVSFALRRIDVAPGTGALAAPRKCLYAHYTGWLMDGKKFDSSRDTMANGKPRTPISFPQGSRRVIAGWDLGLRGHARGRAPATVHSVSARLRRGRSTPARFRPSPS